MHSAEDFIEQRQVCAQLREAAAEREAQVQNELTEIKVSFAQGRQEHEALADEISSLKARRSNIDAQQVTLRAGLCEALGLREADMPLRWANSSRFAMESAIGRGQQSACCARSACRCSCPMCTTRS